MCLQHVTTPEIMKQYVGLKRHNKDMKTYAIDMSFYEQVSISPCTPCPRRETLGDSFGL